MCHTLSPARHRFCLQALLLLACFVFVPRQSLAVEGGTSHYIQGAYGDFLMGYLPAAGFYARNDTIYQAGHIDGALKGGRVYAGLDVHSVVNLTKLTYMFDVPAMNGFLGVGLGVPVIVNLHVSGDASATYSSRSNPTGLLLPDQKSIGGSGNRGGCPTSFSYPSSPAGTSANATSRSCPSYFCQRAITTRAS